MEACVDGGEVPQAERSAVRASEVAVFLDSTLLEEPERSVELDRWRRGDAPGVTVWRELHPAGVGCIPRGQLRPTEIRWERWERGASMVAG